MTSHRDTSNINDPEQIAREIQALRKGRGLPAAFLGDRVGPALHALAGDAAGADPAKTRKVLESELTRLAERLPAELRTAVLAALGLHHATRGMATFGERRAWFASQVIDRDERTAERRVKDAQLLLAEEIALELSSRQDKPPAADGWYIQSFSAILLLDGETPDAIEHRRIVATRPGVDEITVALDLPRDSGQQRLEIQPEVLSGGTLARVDEPSLNRSRFVIRFPGPLQPSVPHEYRMRIRVLPGEPMRSYYVFSPEHRCDHFDLRIRFDRRVPPAWVRVVEREHVRVYEHVEPRTDPVPVDAAGEVSCSFSHLELHYGYGLQWLPAASG